MTNELHTDPAREGVDVGTGVFVRAIGVDGKWDAYDVAELTRDSMHDFAASRGPVSDWALGLLDILLGHPRNE